jgi:hypothetical protein
LITSTDAEDLKIAELFAELAGIDFTCAFEMWEYKLMRHQKQLSGDAVNTNLIVKPFSIFLNQSEMKTRQLFVESLPLNKLLYGNSLSVDVEPLITFLTGLILGGKLDAADEVLGCIKSNTSINYGECIKKIIDSVFETYCKKNNVKKPELTRKQSNLLLEYVSKTKGPYKNLLTQRIKEI